MRTTVGLRFLCGYMNYDKQPINIDEQLALLQNRGLMIEDIATAKLQLRNISYFRIASYLRYMEQERPFRSSPGDVALIFSSWFFFFCIKTKEEEKTSAGRIH